MKNSFVSALRFRKNCVAKNYGSIFNAALFFCLTILAGFIFPSCQKETLKEAKSGYPIAVSDADETSRSKNGNSDEARVLKMYSGLNEQTMRELRQAQEATARYRNIENAIRDGYSNINVDVPNMGHHFMKSSLVDATFDIRNPEILVYNGLDTGHPELIAVEYAVPLDLPMPKGFTGDKDVWNGTSGFPFWLVHAWVWKFNPDGVFNWTNPTVELD